MLLRLARDSGFAADELQMIEMEPSYGAAHFMLFYPMMAYERLVNSSERWRYLRANIFATFRNPVRA
jgi:hypothetical protein